MSEADNREEGVAAKRSKTNDDSDNKEGLLRKIKQLNARNEELAARNDELQSEIRALRGEGKHDDSRLPVVTKRTVDLSRVDPSLVTQVASFLCRSRELLSMALTCKAFGWRRTPSGSSLIEEAARQFLANQLRPSAVERGALPQHGDDTIAWLSILDELERLRLPLKFSKLVGPEILQLSGLPGLFRDFSFVNEAEGFDMLDRDYFDDILAQRTDTWVGNVHYCQLYCRPDDAGLTDVDWTDLQECHEVEAVEESFFDGDIVGLLVDLNEGSLSVYKNGRFLAMAKGRFGPG
ncbi:hypothetical protein THAOC_07928, partial [Thalassiosira oceanica]